MTNSPTHPNDDDSMDSPCAICQINVKDSDKAVECDCQKWFHIKCAKITPGQYKSLVAETFPMTFICKDCYNIRPKNRDCSIGQLQNSTLLDSSTNKTSPNLTNRPRPKIDTRPTLEKIIELLMNDICDLKNSVKDQKEINEKLSEQIAKKMEIISRLDDTIKELMKSGLKPILSHDEPTNESGPNQKNTIGTCHTKMSLTSPDNKKEINNTLTKNPATPLTNKSQTHESGNDKQVHPKAIVISDSILRGAAAILKLENPTTFDTVIKPGATIQDLSRYVTKLEKIPEKVVINIGSNNLSNTKTPNHLMRPIWLLIEAGQKAFIGSKWYVNSILYRGDVRDKIVDEVNLALQYMCRELGATYINTNELMTDDCYGRDKIHPNKKGSEKLAYVIKEAINGKITNGKPKITNLPKKTNDETTTSRPDNDKDIQTIQDLNANHKARESERLESTSGSPEPSMNSPNSQIPSKETNT